MDKGEWSKVVVQYSLHGEYIASFDSVNKAAKAVNGRQPNITACCKGKQKKAYGYIWRYKDDDSIPVNKLNSGIVRRYTLSGRFGVEYPSVSEAAKKLRVRDKNGKIKPASVVATGILACCKGKTQMANGYQWRFKDDVGDAEKIKSYKRPGTRSVAQYTPEGRLMAVHNSIYEAAIVGLGVLPSNKKRLSSSAGNISMHCKHKKQRLCYGYLWRFVDKGENAARCIILKGEFIE